MNSAALPGGDHFMRRALTATCLALLAVTFLACGVRINPNPPGGPGMNNQTIHVTATKLGQDFAASGRAAGGHYAGKPLVITGSVGRLDGPAGIKQEAGPNDPVQDVVFLVPVTWQGQQREYELNVRLKVTLAPEERKAMGLEKGKPVTLQAWNVASDPNNPTAAFNQGVVLSVP
jgi:hypothetical protein